MLEIKGESCIFAIIHDITERKHAEELLSNKNQTLKALNLCNKELLHADDEQGLLDAICKIIVGIGGFQMAGVGFAEDDDNKTVHFVAHHGDSNGYLEKANVNWRDDNKRGCGPVGVAIRTRRAHIISDMKTEPNFKPWRKAALESGYASSVVIPMVVEGRIFGILVVYSSITNDFDKEKLELLENLANNLAYGIHVLRNKHERNKAEILLIENERRFRSAFETSPDAISITSLKDGTIVEVNEGFVRISGFSRKELIGKTTVELGIWPEAEDRQLFLNALQQKGYFSDLNIRLRNKNGDVLPILISANVIHSEGKPYIYAASRDMSDLMDFRNKLEKANWLLKLEKKSLEQISAGLQPKVILQELLASIEEQYTDIYCSVSLLVDRGQYLIPYAASRLPEEYEKEISKIKIGPSEGSCGTAAYRNENVFVSNIAKDPLWKGFKKLANKYGLRACWSMPITSVSGDVYGTISIYYKEPKEADNEHVDLMGHIRKIAEISFEQYKSKNELSQSEERFSLAMQGANDGLWDWNLETDEIYFSPRWKQMLGYEEDEVESHISAFRRLVHPDDIDRTMNTAFEYIEGKHNKFEVEFKMQHGDGSYLDILSRGFGVKNISGKVIRFVGTHVDITQRKKTEFALVKSENRYRALYDGTPAMFFTINQDNKISSVNEFGAEKLGYSVDELVGCSTKDIVLSEDWEEYKSRMMICFLDKENVHNWELRKIKSTGEIIWSRESARVIDDAEGTENLLIVSEDVTEAHKLSQQLSYQASHDALTGLVNRREFEIRLAILLHGSEGSTESHALCYLDLDQFKIINDTCGHLAGDELLRQLGELFQSKVRKKDTLARLGGDEFGVLMENCSLDQARRVANDLRELVEEFQFVWIDKRFSIGVSIGLVPIDDRGGDANEVLSAADAACYAAKDAGRNRIHVYHTEDIDLAVHRGEMQWVSRINYALEENRLRLYMQPIVSLLDENDEKKHYECLIRMIDEDGKIIFPGAFLPAAERYDLSTKIDRWVFDSVYAWMARRRGKRKSLTNCAINLSGHSLSSEEFLEHIVSRLDDEQVPPSNICFEITETVAISKLSNAIRFMEVLKDKGCFFALDDFGSGVSSFGYLKNLPVDILKIDGMFVRDMVDDPIDLEMVRSINEIGHVMGKKTIAEFVENKEILACLKDLGVDYAQGYHLGKPRAVKMPVLKVSEPEIPMKKAKKKKRKLKTRKTD